MENRRVKGKGNGMERSVQNFVCRSSLGKHRLQNTPRWNRSDTLNREVKKEKRKKERKRVKRLSRIEKGRRKRNEVGQLSDGVGCYSCLNESTAFTLNKYIYVRAAFQNLPPSRTSILI